MIHSDRLRLVPTSLALSRSEIHDRRTFARLLGAGIPDNWPPETLADALPFFLALLEEHPDWEGWLGWYAVAHDGAPVLVGSVGFKGPPNAAREVEIGYSVLPQYQGIGYATEMVRTLIGWARSTGQVAAVVAEAGLQNVRSNRVLAKLGFEAAGAGEEPGSTRHRLRL